MLVLILVVADNLDLLGNPRSPIDSIFFLIGGLVSAVSALPTLVAVGYWRNSWDSSPPENVTATERATEKMSDLSG